jgi:uncharacterized Zn finger protein
MPKKITRFTKARLRVKLGDVRTLKRDPSNRIKEAYVSGSNAKLYNVIIRRSGQRITAECQLDCGHGFTRCPGSLQAVCYHSLAVLLQSCQDQGLSASLCGSEDHANKRARIGGTVYKVYSHFRKDRPVYLVVNI